jgi:hypothetical protein
MYRHRIYAPWAGKFDSTVTCIWISTSLKSGARRNDTSRLSQYEQLERVDGSARFGFGLFIHATFSLFIPTKIVWTGTNAKAALSSTSGPLEVRLATENPSHATFEMQLRPLSKVPGTQSKHSVLLYETFSSPSLFSPTISGRSFSSWFSR